MRGKINYLFLILLIISLPISLLLTTLEVVAFDTDYFIKKYEEYNIVKDTGITLNDLSEITTKLLDYLKGKEENVVMFKNVNGKEEQIFEEKEIIHLHDVKMLFSKGFFIRNISVIITLISMIYLYVYDKKKLFKGLILCATIPVSIILILFVFLLLDFNKYFTYFHLVLFDNDLWLLNPNTDILIQMYPLQFFTSIAYKIIFLFIFQLILVFSVGIYFNKKTKNSIE